MILGTFVTALLCSINIITCSWLVVLLETGVISLTYIYIYRYVEVNMNSAAMVWPLFNSLQAFWPGLQVFVIHNIVKYAVIY